MNKSGLWKALLNKYWIELIPFWYKGGLDKVSNVSNIPKLIVLIGPLFSFSFPSFTNLNSDFASKNTFFSFLLNLKFSYFVVSFNTIFSFIDTFFLSSLYSKMFKAWIVDELRSPGKVVP